MSNPSIIIENISKKYTIEHQKGPNYLTLRDSIVGGVRRIFVPDFTKKDSHSVEKEDFWALQNISFEIKEGDCVGIIGRNGAGKSTLLKILSRITEPTAGRISITGRVASLLEVGTGFHPELTGRENIFLNGVILGMKASEVKKKFDEIVDFAEVERFLDTPVKRYSSGMYVRLAFAVAAHLDPEILIVDEGLAVGDLRFQKKCLGKMEEAGADGRTVLFVSHNMGTISKLCSSCIWLEQGKLKRIGDTREIVNAYTLDGQSELKSETVFQADLTKPVQVMRVSVVDQQDNIVTKLSCDQAVNIKLELEVRKVTPGLYGYLGINKPDGTQIMASDSFDVPTINPLDDLSIGRHILMVSIPPRTLGHGDYLISFALASMAADSFQVDNPNIFCGFSMDDYTSNRGNMRVGYFSTLPSWQVYESTTKWNFHV